MTEQEVKVIPNLGSWFRLPNILQMKNEGRGFYQDLFSSQGEHVIKVQLVEPTILVSDSIAANYVFDPEYINKESILGFSGISYNSIMLKYRTPSMFCNGEEHDCKKANSMKIFDHRFKEVTLEQLNTVIQESFESFNTFKAGDNFEVTVDKMAFAFVSFLVLGKKTEHAICRDWFDRSIRLTLTKVLFKPFTYWGDKAVADEVFDEVSDTPVVQKLDHISPDLKDKEGQTLELLHNVCLNGAPLFGEYSISCFARYLDSLDDGQRLSLKEEADQFLNEDPSKFEEAFGKLELIDSFILEVLRLNPIHITGTFGRAKKDFVMESKSGRYQVYKGELITDFVFGMHRDSSVFEEPMKFKLNRDEKNAKKHLVTFGGPWDRQATPTNRKCPGQDQIFIGLKLFVIHLTRCTFDVASDLTYTGKNPARGLATDVPVVMNKVVYKK